MVVVAVCCYSADGHDGQQLWMLQFVWTEMSKESVRRA